MTDKQTPGYGQSWKICDWFYAKERVIMHFMQLLRTVKLMSTGD